MTLVQSTTRASVLLLLFTLAHCVPDRGDSALLVRRYAAPNVDRYVLANFSTADVILIGETRHSDRVANQRVISLLRTWLSDSSLCSRFPKLFLVFEQSQFFVDKFGDRLGNKTTIREIFRREPLPHHIKRLINWTIADLEYYHDLRTIREAVDSIARSHPDWGVQLRMGGIETDTLFASAEEENIFFQTKRDVLSANRLLDQLRQHRDWKFLGSFGNYHAMKKRTSDEPAPRLAEQLIGHGVAVYSVLSSTRSNAPVPVGALTTDIVFPFAPIGKIGGVRFSSLYDACIVSSTDFFGDIRLANILSANTVQEFSYFATRDSVSFCPFVSFLWYQFCGKPLANMNIVGNSTSGLQVLDTARIDSIISRLVNSQGSPIAQLGMRLDNVTGFSPTQEMLTAREDPDAFWRSCIVTNRQDIRLRQLTALLYWGTPEEVRCAEVLLPRLTGKTGMNRKQWLSSYRRQAEARAGVQ